MYTDLDTINNEIRYQKARVDFFDPEHSQYELAEAKKELRKALEAKRIFCYKAKPALTPNGNVVRH